MTRMSAVAGPATSPQRRRWLKLALGAGALTLVGGGSGALWLSGEPAPIAGLSDLPAALGWLQQLRDRGAESTSAWTPAQILEHAAQSVEYSLQGYPRLNSSLFRASVGPIAFRVFARRGQMAHATTEPIPGAPPLQAQDVGAAVQRLARALLRFEATPAGFAFPPHFAYGALGKDDYRRAHLLHLADHARELRLRPAS
jgi:hypothetical protein